MGLSSLLVAASSIRRKGKCKHAMTPGQGYTSSSILLWAKKRLSQRRDEIDIKQPSSISRRETQLDIEVRREIIRSQNSRVSHILSCYHAATVDIASN